MNNDLISRSELKKAINEAWMTPQDKIQILKIVDNAPKVEAVEFEYHSKLIKQAYQKGKDIRPQGEWIKWNFKTFGPMGDWEYKCSNCEKVYGGEHNYCPNCGADMRKGVDNEV